jgi:transposase
MPGPPPAARIILSARQRKHLKRLRRQRTLPQCLVWRVNIVLRAAKGQSNSRIAQHLHMDRQTVQLWRARWVAAAARLQAAEEAGCTRREWQALLQAVLADAPRCGAPGKFSPYQLARIIVVACKSPGAYGRPVTHWTPYELADEVVQQGIVPAISIRTVGRLLAEAALKPHRSRYWLTAMARITDPERFENEVRCICAIYLSAPALHAQGVHLLSTDEKTGMQALERKYSTLPMRPGAVEAREFEYERHGTQCLIANFEIATGKIRCPTLQPTRTEADFAAHIAQTVAADPQGRWIFVTDQLNTHLSASLVEWVAQQCNDTQDLGKKGVTGILHSQATRREYLEDPRHRIRFVYTPKHASWLNQVEIWFSILYRRLLKRGNFTSTADLRQQILDFIDYFNQLLAKPFQWTYTGKPLVA